MSRRQLFGKRTIQSSLFLALTSPPGASEHRAALSVMTQSSSGLRREVRRPLHSYDPTLQVAQQVAE